MLKVGRTSHHHHHHSVDCSAKETRRTNTDKRLSLSNTKKGTSICLALSKLSEAEAEIAKQEKELQERVDQAFKQTFFKILDKSRKIFEKLL